MIWGQHTQRNPSRTLAQWEKKWFLGRTIYFQLLNGSEGANGIILDKWKSSGLKPQSKAVLASWSPANAHLSVSLSPPFLCHLLTFICLEVSGTVSKEHIKFGKVPGFRTRYKFGIGGVEDLWEEKERWGVGEYHRTKAGIERVGLWKPHDWKILLLMLSMDLHFNQNNHRVAVD